LLWIGWADKTRLGKVSWRDINPGRRRLNRDVSAKGPTPWGPEWYDYPGEYELPAQGQAKANLRAEALACIKHRLSGRSTAPGMMTGSLFNLTDAPSGVEDGEYVITKIEHEWDRAKSAFALNFEALSGATVYRPPVESYVPMLRNPLTGFITGPAGADIYTDPGGGIQGNFPRYRRPPKVDNRPHWNPVLQDNTGRSSAMPRTKWEVLCHFLEGDPDRPVVLGRTFNASDPFMEELPIRKTRISLQSLSSPRVEDGRTGYNMIRFDDIAGGQEIMVHAEKDQNIVVANNQDEWVGAVEQRVVQGNEKVSVGANETITVLNHTVAKVDGNQTFSIGGNRQVDASGAYTDSVEGDHTRTIGGWNIGYAREDDKGTVEKNLTEIIGGIVFEQTGKSQNVSGGKTAVLAVGGAIIEIAKKGKAEGTEKKREETVLADLFSMADGKHNVRAEELRQTTVTGSYIVSSLKELLLAGLDKLRVESTDTTLSGTEVTLKVGETEIHLKSGRIDMKAPKEITFDASGSNNLASTTSSQN